MRITKMKVLIVAVLLLCAALSMGCLEEEKLTYVHKPTEEQTYVCPPIEEQTEVPTLVPASENLTELSKFLQVDTTDKHEYTAWYTCGHFARDLARNASRQSITLGGAICGSHPIFRGHQNHIINYIEINDTLYFIEPQTDYIMQVDEIFVQYRFVRLYPDGTQVPSNWKHNLAPTIRSN